MNQIVFVLHSGTTQLQVERDLILTRLSAIISPHMAKFVKYNKLNTAILHGIIIIFSPCYLPETTYVISPFSLRTEL